MEVRKHLLLILPFTLSFSSVRTVKVHQHYTGVSLQYFCVCSNHTDCLMCPNDTQQPVVSLSLGYHLKMEVWHLNTIYLLKCSHSELSLHHDHDSHWGYGVWGFYESCHWLYLQALINHTVHMCRWWGWSSWADWRRCRDWAVSRVNTVRLTEQSCPLQWVHTQQLWKPKLYLVKYTEYPLFNVIWFNLGFYHWLW